MSVEEDASDTIAPRLDAHGADSARIELLSGVQEVHRGQRYERLIDLRDLHVIESAVQQRPDCKLLVVDPVGDFLGGQTDAHRDTEVRAVLSPLGKLAQRLGLAVLAIVHNRKAGGTVADDLALGSRAFTGVARGVWHVFRDPDDRERRLMLTGKSNLAAEGDGLAFRIGETPARVLWEADPVAMSADDFLASTAAPSQRGRKPEQRQQATDWLRDRLAAGPVDVAILREDAETAGLAWRTVERAREKLGVLDKRAGFPARASWALAEEQLCQNANTAEYWHNCTKPEESDQHESAGIQLCQKSEYRHNRPTKAGGDVDDINALLAGAAAEEAAGDGDIPF